MLSLWQGSPVEPHSSPQRLPLATAAGSDAGDQESAWAAAGVAGSVQRLNHHSDGSRFAALHETIEVQSLGARGDDGRCNCRICTVLPCADLG